MNKFLRILSGAAVLALFAACDPNTTPKFDENDAFASFDKSSIEVSEDAGTVSIPVTIATIDPVATTVTYSVEDGGTAVEGTNFSLADPSAVLTFDGKTRSGNIVVNIVDLAGKYTGDLSFTIKIDNATGLNIGADNTCKVTIGDKDHPLADILGSYAVACTNEDATLPNSYTMTLSKDPDDVSVVWCDYIMPFSFSNSTIDLAVYGNVSGTAGHRVISFPYNQETKYVNSTYGKFVFDGWTDAGDGGYNVIQTGNAVFTEVSDGVFTSPDQLTFLATYVWGLSSGFTWTKK
ncbi:MAG: hypothetical protein LKI42_03460 [Bacteroidales bacterium]|jgi:hypothetical protein|nr:hypothetical protein [Bacteroidales bacterium]MCI1785711.1 hypothetical protein [Bacteroidales bacterium]